MRGRGGEAAIVLNDEGLAPAEPGLRLANVPSPFETAGGPGFRHPAVMHHQHSPTQADAPVAHGHAAWALAVIGSITFWVLVAVLLVA